MRLGFPKHKISLDSFEKTFKCFLNLYFILTSKVNIFSKSSATAEESAYS